MEKQHQAAPGANAVAVLWGPASGSELDSNNQPNEAKVVVRESALRGLRPSLPGAYVTDCHITYHERVVNGRKTPGYLVILFISLPATTETAKRRDPRFLRFWIESEVATALLELINPIDVDWVNVTPVAGGQSAAR